VFIVCCRSVEESSFWRIGGAYRCVMVIVLGCLGVYRWVYVFLCKSIGVFSFGICLVSFCHPRGQVPLVCGGGWLLFHCWLYGVGLAACLEQGGYSGEWCM